MINRYIFMLQKDYKEAIKSYKLVIEANNSKKDNEASYMAICRIYFDMVYLLFYIINRKITKKQLNIQKKHQNMQNLIYINFLVTIQQEYHI